MITQIEAALKAAQKYEHKNEGDRSEVEFIRSLLGDVLTHARQLDDLAASHERTLARQEAERAHAASGAALREALDG